MTKVRRMAAMVMALLICTGGALAETPAERVQRNIGLLRSGAIMLKDLSAEERQELAIAERAARDGSPLDGRTARQRCIDEEIKREGHNPSELTMRIIDLRCSQR